ncbi:MAG: DUF928 domain-containing protein [Cyanobacteria bacterium P01_A01_bin.105]
METVQASISVPPDSVPPDSVLPDSLTPEIAQRPPLGYPTRGTRRGGASRGGTCHLAADVSPLTALMPADPDGQADALAPPSVVSLTRQTAPNLWFYLPYPVDAHSQIDFVVKDADQNTLHQARLATDRISSQGAIAPGIIQVSLRDLDIALRPDWGYHWYFTVRCDGGGAVSVDGWLHHLATAAPPPAPGNATLHQIAENEAHEGFWVDSLTTLVEGLRDASINEADREQLQTTWQSLLSAEGLADIIDHPVQDCCEFERVP